MGVSLGDVVVPSLKDIKSLPRTCEQLTVKENHSGSAVSMILRDRQPDFHTDTDPLTYIKGLQFFLVNCFVGPEGRNEEAYVFFSV